MLPYCRVFDKAGVGYVDVPAEEYPRIKEALQKHITFRDDELVETTSAGTDDPFCFLISTIGSICLRTPEGLRVSFQEERDYAELHKSVAGWE